ncbi:MAG TPA: DinB family protein [Pyrinomonadaceae bacterium]
MDYKTIDDVYTANASIRRKFKEAISQLTDEQISAKPDPERWSIREVVEHVAIVSEGMSKICAKLLSKAAEKPGDGSLQVSPEFFARLESIREEKMKAPEMVLPIHSLSVAASLERLDSGEALFSELRSSFGTVDCSEIQFPHPLLGNLSAQEWLVLAGAHEARHLKQIRNLVAELTS